MRGVGRRGLGCGGGAVMPGWWIMPFAALGVVFWMALLRIAGGL